MDVYAIVNEKIISLLETGVVPWRKPWTSAGLPRNLVSKKPYRGINVFLLSASKYISPFWLTLRQANELGGHVRKSEESTIVVYWKVDDVMQRSEDLDVEETVKGFCVAGKAWCAGKAGGLEILRQDLNVARFFTPYVDGLYRISAASIFVSRGIGTIALPTRLGAPPEVALLRLCRT